MIDPSEISEHMDVVGSDGQHVGTVDKLCIKLTKNDPDAGGRHHVLNLEMVAGIEGNTLKLTVPASAAWQEETSLQG